MTRTALVVAICVASASPGLAAKPGFRGPAPAAPAIAARQAAAMRAAIWTHMWIRSGAAHVQAAEGSYKAWMRLNPGAGAQNEYWHNVDAVAFADAHNNEHIASAMNALRARLPVAYARYLYEVNDFTMGGAYTAQRVAGNAFDPHRGTAPGDKTFLMYLLYGAPVGPFDAGVSYLEALQGYPTLQAKLRTGQVW